MLSKDAKKIKVINISRLFGLVLAWLVANPAWGYNNLPVTEPFPSTVHLSKDCAESNGLANCADNMAELLNWVWSIRRPDATSPLAIQVGPGRFANFYCPDGGNHVSVRGSGRTNTVIFQEGSQSEGVLAAVSLRKCTDLDFQDLGIEGGTWGIYQGGSSRTTYTNINVTASENAWWGFPNFSDTERFVHLWFNSILTVTAGEGCASASSRCATFFGYGNEENWFYGGEITMVVPSGLRGSAVFLSDLGGGVPTFQSFGTAIRTVAASGALVDELRGVVVKSGAVFHAHGGIIAVDASAAGSDSVDIYAISNEVDAKVHTPGMAFTLKGVGSGKVARVLRRAPNSVVASPFLWGASNTPPPLTLGRDGADMFVETDCLAGGDCDSGTGNEPHLMIFSKSCAQFGAPWFDSIRGKCRGAP